MAPCKPLMPFLNELLIMWPICIIGLIKACMGLRLLLKGPKVAMVDGKTTQTKIKAKVVSLKAFIFKDMAQPAMCIMRYFSNN